MTRHFPFCVDPLRLYEGLQSSGPRVLLESARIAAGTGRYSIVGDKPFLMFQAKGRRVTLEAGGRAWHFTTDPFLLLKKILRHYAVPANPGADGLPFAGGAVGFFSYPQTAHDDLAAPDIYLLFLNQGFVVDHVKGTTSIFGAVPVASLREAKRRGPQDILFSVKNTPTNLPAPNRRSETMRRLVRSSFTKAGFMRAVRAAKRAIARGDIYQANIAQRFQWPCPLESAREIYGNLRAINPSPFFGLLETDGFALVSGSPERLVCLKNDVLETRPIAGTRPRGANPSEDDAKSLELLLSAKERAEHVMLVDLERNDLGRVAEYGSVEVDELMAIEDYSHVKHIVSNVRAVLRKELGAVDAFQALFPGGTITGAPKLRCLEVIDALEPVARGPYTGSLGYFSFDGAMDFNIIIRSLFLKNGRAYLGAGAGIVADSDPEKEYDETLHKAEAVLRAAFASKKERERSRVSAG